MTRDEGWRTTVEEHRTRDEGWRTTDEGWKTTDEEHSTRDKQWMILALRSCPIVLPLGCLLEPSVDGQLSQDAVIIHGLSRPPHAAFWGNVTTPGCWCWSQPMGYSWRSSHSRTHISTPFPSPPSPTKLVGAAQAGKHAVSLAFLLSCHQP